jgi:hypothetical protein
MGVFIKKISHIILVLIFIFSCRDKTVLELHKETDSNHVNRNLHQDTEQEETINENVNSDKQEIIKESTTAVVKPIRDEPIKTHSRVDTNRSFPNNFDKIFVTIKPQQLIKGPILDLRTTSYNDYADTIISMALKEAHNISKEYLITKEYKKYYTMMLLSLVVPAHESMTLHFRKVINEVSRCSDKKNNGELLVDQEITKRNYINAFRKKSRPFLANCSELKSDQEIYQLIAGGSDGSDIGIMQVSSRWHYENYLATEKYKSVKASLNYGIKFLHTGFNKIARNAKNYPCILKQNKSIDYHKLARATWGGWYNAGQVQKACRFSNSRSKHIKKDNLFHENLKRTIKSGSGKPFGSIIAKEARKMLTLPINKKTRQVILEISQNIDNGTNKRTYLSGLISK